MEEPLSPRSLQKRVD